MNENIKVTVLMTVYNGGEYLKQSVKSVLDQTYRDFEFLIINDCSTDNSIEIIKSFCDERIRIHHNEDNLGQTKSLNIGLKMALGEYIARIDADDVALPKWVEAQVESIKEYSDCSVVSSYVFAVDEQNRIKKLYNPPLDMEEIILRSLIASPINHVSSIIKKKDAVENGGYDEQYITAADFGLWSKLLRGGFRITTTPKILVAIREHVHSLSRSGGGRETDEITDIVSTNIKEFTNTEFSDDEIRLFCRVNYDNGNLTIDEFNEALRVTKGVYMNLVPSLKIENQKMVQWMRNRCRILYLKRIFSVINRKDYFSVKTLSRKAIKEFGPFSIFTIFLLASLLDGMVIDFIPKLYNDVLKRKARFQLGLQPNMGIFK